MGRILGWYLVPTVISRDVQDHSGKCLTEEQQILNRWTEYCSELYNHKASGDPLNCPQTDTEDDHPILHKKSGGCITFIEEREVSLSRQHPSRTGPSRWRGCNYRSHNNLQQDLADRKMAKHMDPVLSHHTSQERQRTKSFISHPSKVMLKIILNRLKPQAEEIVAEEQAGFRAGRSTTEQIFNIRILCEKYLQHQQDLYRVFIDFKKAFDRVW